MTAFGVPRLHHRLIGSTNERARELADGGAPAGTVVTAAEQTAGRGRHGRAWVAPAGTALLCSAILRPLGRRHRLLPLAVPLAVCDAVEALAAVRTQVKWPNDVWIDGRKVAGILIEACFPDWAVIGVGINLAVDPDGFPADLRWPATSVGHGATPDLALAALCDALGPWCDAAEDEVLAEFRRRDALLGRPVSWEGAGDAGEGSGIATGVDGDGNLVARLDGGGRVRLGAGDVRLRVERP